MAHEPACDDAASSRRSSGIASAGPPGWAARADAGRSRRWPWVGRGHGPTVPDGRNLGQSGPVRHVGVPTSDCPGRNQAGSPRTRPTRRRRRGPGQTQARAGGHRAGAESRSRHFHAGPGQVQRYRHPRCRATTRTMDTPQTVRAAAPTRGADARRDRRRRRGQTVDEPARISDNVTRNSAGSGRPHRGSVPGAPIRQRPTGRTPLHPFPSRRRAARSRSRPHEEPR